MKVLTKDQMKEAAEVLEAYMPQSHMVYGHLLQLSRIRSFPMDIIVDTWPDFTAVICKPRVETEGDLFKDLSVFSTDGASLRKILAEPAIINWEKFFCLGTDLSQEAVLKAEAECRGVSWNRASSCYMLKLHCVSHLPTVGSAPGLRISCLSESHVDLVNQTWKFGAGEHSVRMIQDMIRHFPSCCLQDGEGRPVAWVLTYPSGSMGMLYTMPEHRGKGYAKIVVHAMSQRLHREGFPAYCFIEEENKLSFRLFKSLGFTEDPTYRVAWFRFNHF